MRGSKFIEIRPDEIQRNPFQMIGKQWFLLTAGNMKHYNTMTASWGGLGVLWNKPVSYCFVRPHRYTFGFMESGEHYTMSFLEEKHRDTLNYCGKYSGRTVNKPEATGLIPVEGTDGSVFFEQAELVIMCRKLYYSDIDPSHFRDEEILKNYPSHDFHRMYFGEIVKCLVRK